MIGLQHLQVGEIDLFLFEPIRWVGQLNGFFFLIIIFSYDHIYWLKCHFLIKNKYEISFKICYIITLLTT